MTASSGFGSSSSIKPEFAEKTTAGQAVGGPRPVAAILISGPGSSESGSADCRGANVQRPFFTVHLKAILAEAKRILFLSPTPRIGSGTSPSQ
jgi:hypothetical protein